MTSPIAHKKKKKEKKIEGNYIPPMPGLLTKK
jgi:hypothetical protein